MYSLTLFVHSLLRWVVLALCVLVCVRSLVAWWGQRSWQPLDGRLHAALIRTVDVQFLFGLLLYVFLSPLSRAFWLNLSTAMKDPVARFYGLEHVLGMFVAIAVLHVGHQRSTRVTTDALRHRRVWISTLVALVLILALIPWPERPYGRPLFRPLW